MKCEHEKISLPEPLFDETRAKGFTQSQVRHMWPRSEARCPDCNELVCRYANFKHYVYGGWA